MSGVVRSLSRCLLPAEASREPGGSKERSRERDAAQEREARRRSREIDAMLARERRAVRRLVKILLLGAGESGKSTFLKQMRIINGQEFDKKALLDFRDTIYENILKVIWGVWGFFLAFWVKFLRGQSLMVFFLFFIVPSYQPVIYIAIINSEQLLGEQQMCEQN